MTGLAFVLAAPLLGPAPAASAELVIAGEQVAYDRVFDRDADGDGKVDQRAYYLGELMVAAAIDANHDGKMEAWLSFDESMRVRRVARDKDGDGAPELAQSIGGDGRARGEPELIADAKAIEERVLAPDVSSEPEAETKPEAQVAAPFKVWRIYPLDWRLWTALGIFGLSLLPFGMALRKR